MSCSWLDGVFFCFQQYCNLEKTQVVVTPYYYTNELVVAEAWGCWGEVIVSRRSCKKTVNHILKCSSPCREDAAGSRWKRVPSTDLKTGSRRDEMPSKEVNGS